MSKDISNEEIFEFMTKMYGEMQEGFTEIRGEIQENRNEIRKINVKIEHEIMPKLDVLFDGYKQNSYKLDRIEREITRHDEIILRRVR